MWNNITPTDKTVRFVVATFALFGAVVYHPLFILPVVALYLSAATNSCLFYKMLGINHSLEQQSHYLSILPRYNPEPVLLFCDQGNLLFHNEAAKKDLASLKLFAQFKLQQMPKELINSQTQSVIRYKEADKTYQLVLRGNKEENFLMVYGFDISLIVSGEEKLRKLALCDPLTTMANRKQLIIDMQNLQGRSITLLDIKNFGQINAFYGHEIGDSFLQSFAKLLFELEKEWHDTTVYRVQSDIFAIFYPQNDTYLQTLHTFFEERYLTLGDLQFVLELTMGHAINEQEEHSLLTMAETSLMEAKKRGVNSLEYSQLGDVRARYLDNLEWSKRIKHILNHEDRAKIAAYFQPIYNTQTQQIEKYETLVRVLDEGSVLSPALFLNPAKQLGLLPKITHAMIDAITQKAQQSEAEFSINITTQDLRSEGFAELFLGILKDGNIAPSRVVLEILEDEESYEFLHIFKELKTHGCKIAIDDFGTGYSNFAKLQQIEVDYIKIDGTLIESIQTTPQHLQVVRTINNYAHSIGAKTIAEFVSSEAIKEILIAEKIDYLQGYAIGQPLPTLIV